MAECSLSTGTISLFGAQTRYDLRDGSGEIDSVEIEPESNPVLRLVRRFLPVTNVYHGQKFFVDVDGKKHATPLFIAVLFGAASRISSSVASGFP